MRLEAADGMMLEPGGIEGVPGKLCALNLACLLGTECIKGKAWSRSFGYPSGGFCLGAVGQGLSADGAE